MSERNIAEIIRRLSQDFLEGGWPKWCVEPTNRYHYLTCVPRNFPPPPPKKKKPPNDSPIHMNSANYLVVLFSWICRSSWSLSDPQLPHAAWRTRSIMHSKHSNLIDTFISHVPRNFPKKKKKKNSKRFTNSSEQYQLRYCSAEFVGHLEFKW